MKSNPKSKAVPMGSVPVHSESGNIPVKKIVARCVRCNSEFTEEQIKYASDCPNCHTKSIPNDPKDDIELKINWHELRIICNWAWNWAEKNIKNNPEMRYTLHLIVSRLQKQYPDKTPLTIEGEFKELGKEYNAEMTTISGRKIKVKKNEA